MSLARHARLIALVSVVAVGGIVACGAFGSDESSPLGADAATATEGGATGMEAGPAPSCEGADTSTSPHHCGACGHDCLGGTCIAGKCQPVELAVVMATTIPSMGVDSLRVVWSDGSKLFQCAKAGCQGKAAAATATAIAPTAVASNPNGVFTAAGGGNSGHVGHLSTDDAYTRLGDAPGYPFAVAAYDGHPYVLDDDNIDPTGLFGPRPDGAPGIANIGPQHVVGSVAERNWGYVAANATHVFAADYGHIDYCKLPACPDGWLAAAGGDPEPVSLHLVTGLVATAGDLYWTSREQPGLYTCPFTEKVGGCGRGTAIAGGKLAPGAVPRGLVLAGGRIHLTTGDTLASCVPEKCSTTWVTHVEGQEVVTGPAADETALYWAAAEPMALASDGGPIVMPRAFHIMKLAK